MITDFKSKRLYQEIAIAIANDIKSGKYPIGKRLPNERKMAEIKKVSRSVIREAYLALEVAGIIYIQMGSGAYVQQISYDLISMLHTLDMGPSPSDLIDTRILLERELAAQSALCTDDTAKQNIIQALEYGSTDHHANANPLNYADDPDLRFHMAIAKSTNNMLGVDLVVFLWKGIRMPLMAKLEKNALIESYSQESLIDHKHILDAILASDAPLARTHMQNHLHKYKSYVLEPHTHIETRKEYHVL